MGFSGWLRHNAEHYLLVDAHRRLAGRYGTPAPRPPRGAKDFFWLRIFAPLYGLLPWSVRHRVMRAMPGSHRKTWAPPPTRGGPAV
ncbi:hypothetical protein GCM10023321_52260 [Pseudonocardia eucalypti]|uniref:ER-bound oxygenase mpaB/mpaB'/Rubber oxygenase catalytic domain-containing protein n=1 Tax=Pseudonocardia eucalypti TaxID=648755 RepID=A0ABP9QM30_9PSEU|nr:hypothetical protein [Pseudonocardia eucalypti]